MFTAPKGGPLQVIAFPGSHLAASGQNAGLDGLRIDLHHTRWPCGSRPAPPEKVAARAGHTSTSFTLDRYGHLYPESDAALRDRLDAIYSAGQRDQGADVVELFRERSRPQRSPERGERRRQSTDILTSMALLAGERITRGWPPPSTFRWACCSVSHDRVCPCKRLIARRGRSLDNPHLSKQGRPAGFQLPRLGGAMDVPADRSRSTSPPLHPSLREAVRSPRRRRPTGAAPLPYRLQTSGIGWLVAAVVLVGLTLAIFARGMRGPAVTATVIDDAIVGWLAGLVGRGWWRPCGAWPASVPGGCCTRPSTGWCWPCWSCGAGGTCSCGLSPRSSRASSPLSWP